MNQCEKILFFLLSLLPVLLALQPAAAESPSFKIFTTENGLAHDSVNRIVRDSRGFLWFCTAEGLSRFDGRRFTNFTQDEGLPHRNVNDFLELRDGTYLLATNQGLVVFNPNGKAYRWNVLESRLERTGEEPPMFETFTPDTANAQKKEILALAEDASGTVWAGTGFGLFRAWRAADGGWRLEEFEVDKNFEMPFYAVRTDSRGGLLICAAYSAYRLFQNKVEKFDSLGGRSMIETRDGRIWLGAAGGASGGLRVFRFNGDHLKLERTFTKADGLFDDINQFSLAQTSDGRIFVGQFKGLQEFLPEKSDGEPKFRPLTGDVTNTLAEDSAGNLWVGTNLKGAWQMTRSGFSLFGEKDGISESEDIRSIGVSRTGEIYLPTRPQKILHLTADGTFEGVVPAGLKGRSYGWHQLDFEAADGEWWIPASNGLLRYRKPLHFADLARTPPVRVYTKRDGLHGDEMFVLFEDSRGDIWITGGNENGNTLSRWERAGDKIYSYSTADGLPANGAVSFAEDAHGNIWFGHYFGSLTRYRNGKFENFTAKDGLPESPVNQLLTDSNGRLWIATSGRGLFRIDDTNADAPLFTSVSTQNGLSSNQVICLTADRFGRVYAGTGRGINRLEANGVVRVFTQSDGLPGNFVTRCAADKKGDLWFVSQNVLVRFTPEIEKPVTPPQVFIDKFSVNGVPQKISVLGETEIELPDLSSDQTQIEIGFFALSFGAAENIRYEYRLDTQDWSSPSEQTTLSLNLNAGRHFFAVRAVRTDGGAGERAATVSFRILSPVWQRWWFILLAALLVALAIISVYRYRTKNLRAINAALTEAKLAEENLRKSKEERLAELEQVRARIATDLHDDIGASLTQIAILSEVARQQKIAAADGAKEADSEPLTMIYSVSNELVDSMSDIVWAINPQKDRLHDLTLRMRRFAADVLTAKNIDFEFNAPEEIEDFSLNSNLRRELFLIFKETINNVVKHSGATAVEVEFEMTGEELFLNVKDNGRGFEAEKTAARSSKNLYADYKGGNGLPSMKRRAAEMGGALEIESAHGRGTVVRLRMPVAIRLGGDFPANAG